MVESFSKSNSEGYVELTQSARPETNHILKMMAMQRRQRSMPVVSEEDELNQHSNASGANLEREPEPERLPNSSPPR